MSKSVREWLIPLWGSVAEKDLPQWMIDAWSSKVISLNSFGGFTKSTKDGEIIGYPGDLIFLDEIAEIQFCPTDERDKNINN